MLSYISKILKSNKNEYPFDKQYRNGYNKLWINTLKDYYP